MASSVTKDYLYGFDDARIQSIREAKAWMHDPKHFKRVKISPSATMKMMMHGQSGVDKGIKKSGKPIEVMGILIGKPDIEDPHCIVVTDAQALPIEGFETTVVANDDSVLNYMIELGDSLEISRKERFCGWYHTHPFDVDVHSNCFLSNTDISTQLQWQRAEDPHGNPWLAIVIDPLRSLAKNKPEMGAFRVYPPEYSAPSNECPDGKRVDNDSMRVTQWGACWNRYYKLDISYFMSSLAQATLGTLKNKFLWQNAFSTSENLEIEAQQQALEQITTITDNLQTFEAIGHKAMSTNSELMGLGLYEDHVPMDSYYQQGPAAAAALAQVTKASAGLAAENCQACICQLLKHDLFVAFAKHRAGKNGSSSSLSSASSSSSFSAAAHQSANISSLRPLLSDCELCEASDSAAADMMT